jgi:hypothetical protein
MLLHRLLDNQLHVSSLGHPVYAQCHCRGEILSFDFNFLCITISSVSPSHLTLALVLSNRELLVALFKQDRDKVLDFTGGF